MALDKQFLENSDQQIVIGTKKDSYFHDNVDIVKAKNNHQEHAIQCQFHTVSAQSKRKFNFPVFIVCLFFIASSVAAFRSLLNQHGGGDPGPRKVVVIEDNDVLSQQRLFNGKSAEVVQASHHHSNRIIITELMTKTFV